MNAPQAISTLARVRLPRWLTGANWPSMPDGSPMLASIDIAEGRVRACTPVTTPMAADADADGGTLDAGGALALPGLVDAHTHLDKTFTAARIAPERPGLLGAIDAMMKDRGHWTQQDIRDRASQALELAWRAGVMRVRSHVDWWEPAEPLAWRTLGELAREWAGRIRIERVALIPQPMFADAALARQLARHIAASGPDTLLGGFIHTHHWDAQALEHLLAAAAEADLDLDLHVDEELAPAAIGLSSIAQTLARLDYAGRAVCGHVCALAAQPEAQALATLDAVARAPITLVSLPITNLLLQDAVTGRTPRQRGITLVKEARARGIPVLIASDNVEDPFCAVGSYDPVEALAAGVLAAQLPEAFDDWSQSLCRADWLDRGGRAGWGDAPPLIGQSADFVLFGAARLHSWPSRAQVRTVIRAGAKLAQD